MALVREGRGGYEDAHLERNWTKMAGWGRSMGGLFLGKNRGGRNWSRGKMSGGAGRLVELGMVAESSLGCLLYALGGGGARWRPAGELGGH